MPVRNSGVARIWK